LAFVGAFDLFDFVPMSAREQRLAENEAFFRGINERLEEQTPDSAPVLIVLCECADVDCAMRLTLEHEEYEAIRAESTHFVVAHGHADVEIEEVVYRTDRFEVVRKRGLAGEIAQELDTSDEAQPA
jgi:hypothetical protein